MNEQTTIEPSGHTEPPQAAVPAPVGALLGRLDEAQDIAMRMLRRMDRMAEEMTPEEQKETLAEKSHLTLNMTRTFRALRQLGVLQEEVMGRREPATARGPAGGGNGGGDGRGRHDFNDLNDLNDLNDPEDQPELEDLYDLNDPFQREEYADLDSLAKYNTFQKYQFNRKRDWEMFYAKVREDNIRERAIAEKRWEEDKLRTPEENRVLARQREADFKAWNKAEPERLESLWRARREALLRRRKEEKRQSRSGRGPPGG